MIKHAVLFKLIPFKSEEEKQAKMQELKTALENLIHMIPELQQIHVGLNINPEEQWDIILETVFENMEDLGVYAKHPAHVAVGKDILSPVKADRACVDFIF